MKDITEGYDTLPPALSPEEEGELWRRYVATEDEEARGRLIENYLPLVFQTAERLAKHFPAHLDIQDLISYGNLGLLDAIRKFKPGEGVKFSTYCNLRISGAIFDELRRLDWISRQLRSKVNQEKRVREELEVELGRAPYDDEMAERLGIGAGEYAELRQEVQIKTMVPLDRKWDDNGDNDSGPVELLPDAKAPDPLNELIRAEIKEVALRGLSADEKQVLILYYYENMNLKDIGLVLDLSESRVCQIHQKTLNFLKQKFTERQISPYMF
ncbi:MAG: FliA/WhiG family RNA polymerase sigma factor [Planctomycetota bacterium]|jgi:RNA polymerase sigma factor for flagellar operon FliA|nr:FliA/WhiG family RNA polymerase sigma factor [Planctomycetota bacterium]